MQQISMFNGKESFKFTKPIRLIELFAGYGSQHFALKYLGKEVESWRICEWAVKSIQAYKDAHFGFDNKDYSSSFDDDTIFKVLYSMGISSNYNNPMSLPQIKRLGIVKARRIYNNIKATRNLVNIQNVHSYDLEIKDTDKYDYVMTYSFPCGLAGTKIITKNGYKNIEDITTNDYVLTHNNRFCKVNKTMSRISNHYYILKGLGVPELFLTEEHPLYVLRNGNAQWVKVKDLKYTDMFAFNVNQKNIDVDLSNEYLWLLGRYVADGYINKYLYNSVLFSIGNKKEQQFLDNIPQEMKSKFKVYQKACVEYRIADKTLQDYCLQFGNGALNKKIPQWVIDLPKDKLQSFFDGYIAGDGHIRYRKTTKQIMFSTTSQLLFLGLQQIIAKLYGCVCSCYIRNDNRKSTFNNTYNCQFNCDVEHRHQLYKDTKIFTKIKKIDRVDKEIAVYNFEVDKDNSYTCNNVIVHNCQDLSLAGLGKGMDKGSGTRSGMLWEVERLLEECKGNLPKVLIMENVPQIHSKKNINSFNEWQQKLESLGYSNYWKDLNAKNFGIPQNRNRCFMISILGDYYYEFPEEEPLKLGLKDMLEDENEVDEKYYLSDKMKDYIISKHDKYIVGKNSCVLNRKIGVTVNTRVGETRADCSDYICKDLPENYNLREQLLKEPIACELRCDEGIRTFKGNVMGTLRTIDACGNKHIIENKLILKSKNKRIKSLVDKMNKSKDCQFMDIYNQKTIENETGTLKAGMDYQQGNIIYNNLRIRKLTPKECFRIMGVRDEDFEKIAQNQSNASLYHLAGDSLVTTVMMAILKKML